MKIDVKFLKFGFNVIFRFLNKSFAAINLVEYTRRAIPFGIRWYNMESNSDALSTFHSAYRCTGHNICKISTRAKKPNRDYIKEI